MAENWAKAAATKVNQARKRESDARQLEERKQGRVAELALKFWAEFTTIANRAVDEFNQHLTVGDKIQAKLTNEVVEFRCGLSMLKIEPDDKHTKMLWKYVSIVPDKNTIQREYSFELTDPQTVALNVDGQRLRPAEAVQQLTERFFLDDLD